MQGEAKDGKEDVKMGAPGPGTVRPLITLRTPFNEKVCRPVELYEKLGFVSKGMFGYQWRPSR